MLSYNNGKLEGRPAGGRGFKKKEMRKFFFWFVFNKSSEMESVKLTMDNSSLCIPLDIIAVELCTFSVEFSNTLH